MPKDYKDAPSPRGDSRLNHPLLLGMIIGLLMGIVISLAVALWLNRLSNPFMEKGNKPVEAPPKLGAAQPPPPPEAARAAAKAAEAAKIPAEEPKVAAKAPAKSERPRFEFYQILPGEKEAPDKAPPKAAPPTPPAAQASAKPGSSPAMPKPHAGETYWLQAGAFAEEKEADNLKARIAFTGLEATVRAVNIPDKGTLYRVRLGPYQSLDDANRIKSALSQNGVGAAIIRATDEAKTQ
jgi:cell division septation protein DedD